MPIPPAIAAKPARNEPPRSQPVAAREITEIEGDQQVDGKRRRAPTPAS
jgi:hypothetical protein